MSNIRHVAVIALASLGSFAQPCCAVSGEEAVVTFRGQQNIIVWDPATKTEHFIRKADFDSKNKGLGFIAPSPTKPELGEASFEAFTYLGSLQPEPPLALGETKSVATEAAGVEVVHEQDVAGYHAVVLKATDEKSLAAWLKENGFVSTPDVEAWTKQYIAKDWYFTAFKVLPGKFETSTGIVRMSFKTENPFNPYSVPKSNGSGTGSLSVFFVSPARVEGKIGGEQGWVKESWHANGAVDRDKLAGLIGTTLDDMPKKLTVSHWYDRKFPAPGNDDIFFQPVHEASVFSPAGGGVAAVTAALIASLVARRRRKASTDGV